MICKIRMAPPVLYASEVSPPCRGVLLAAAAAGIKLDVRPVNLRAGEHRTEEFVKMNPQHTLPTLNDNGFIFWDSHAIVTYLIEKYAKDDSLYPKDLKLRTLINQRLHFDNAILVNHMKATVFPILYKGATQVPQQQYESIKEAYDFLDKILGDNDWLAGDSYTLADICSIATVSSLTAFVSLDKYPRLVAWAKRCEAKIPGYATANAPGATAFHGHYAKFRSNI